MDLAQLAEDRMMKLGHENIYSIVLRGFAPPDFKADFSKLNRRFMVTGILDQTLSEKEMELITVENENNLMGRFVQQVEDSLASEKKIREKAVRYGMEALIRAGE